MSLCLLGIVMRRGTSDIHPVAGLVVSVNVYSKLNYHCCTESSNALVMPSVYRGRLIDAVCLFYIAADDQRMHT